MSARAEKNDISLAKTAGFALLALGLTILLAYLIVGVGWAVAPAKLYSFENVREQHKDFYGKYEGLKALNANITNTQEELDVITNFYGDDTTKWPDSRRQEYLQLVHLKAQYRSAFNMQ